MRYLIILAILVVAVNARTKYFFCGMESTEAEIRSRCIETDTQKKHHYCFKDKHTECGYCNAKVYACMTDPSNPKQLENNRYNAQNLCQIDIEKEC